MNNRNELLSIIEDVQNVCINMVTGKDFNYEKYEEARNQLLAQSELKSLFPDWLIDNRYGSQFWKYIKARFSTYQERRIFLRTSFDEMADFIKSGGNQPVAPLMIDTIKDIDSQEIDKLWKKTIDRVHTDPEGAITAARSLLESTIKYILDQEGEPYTKNDDLIDLYKKLKRVLKLDPAQHNLQTFKQILNGVTSVVQGFNSLRSDYGDAHGKGVAHYKVENRHAVLTINLSASLCTFLIETYTKKLESNQ